MNLFVRGSIEWHWVSIFVQHTTTYVKGTKSRCFGSENNKILNYKTFSYHHHHRGTIWNMVYRRTLRSCLHTSQSSFSLKVLLRVYRRLHSWSYSKQQPSCLSVQSKTSTNVNFQSVLNIFWLLHSRDHRISIMMSDYGMSYIRNWLSWFRYGKVIWAILEIIFHLYRAFMPSICATKVTSR